MQVRTLAALAIGADAERLEVPSRTRPSRAGELPEDLDIDLIGWRHGQVVTVTFIVSTARIDPAVTLQYARRQQEKLTATFR